jgi:hypothetical protein
VVDSSHGDALSPPFWHILIFHRVSLSSFLSPKTNFFSCFSPFVTGDAFHRFRDIWRPFLNVAISVTVCFERAHPLKHHQPLRLNFRAA